MMHYTMQCLPTRKINTGLILAFLSAGAIAQATVPQPILYYNFNSSTGQDNTYTPSSGSSTDMDLRMYNQDKEWDNLLSASGTGVSGALGDRALDLSSATGMGQGPSGGDYHGGGAQSVKGLDQVLGFSGAQSLTIAGWIYSTESSIRNGAQIVNVSNASTDGFRLSGTGSGRLHFDYVGSTQRQSFSSDSSNAWSAVGEWMFFAMVLDVTADTEANPVGSLTYYAVNPAGQLVVDSTHSVTGGPMAIGERGFTLGNFSGTDAPSATNRPYQGYLDDLAFWADHTGSGGALTIEQLDAYRLATIPEPSTFASILGVLLLGCITFRLYRSSSRS